MTVSLSYLLGAIILSVFQVFLAAAVKRSQDGLEWGTGNRDTDPPNYTGLAGRMVRAQANLLETLPGFIGAVLIAHVCRATITMRTRVNQDENLVRGEAGRA
jgi:uncharacterized MAPEG superfamily protein